MTDHPEEARVTLPSDREVLVVRAFSAPRGLVYRAYTEPDLMRRWLLGPPGWTMPVCGMDVRVGGSFRWLWRSEEDGSEFGFHGEFVEVVPGERLAHTQIHDPGDVGGIMGENGESMVTVSFEEREGMTTVRTRIDFGSEEARDAALATGMTDGMEASYRSLDALVTEKGPAGEGPAPDDVRTERRNA